MDWQKEDENDNDINVYKHGLMSFSREAANELLSIIARKCGRSFPGHQFRFVQPRASLIPYRMHGVWCPSGFIEHLSGTELV